MNKFAEFFREFDRNRIFLPDSVCAQIDEFFKGMRQRVIHFGVYAQTNEHAPEHVIKEKYEGWAKSSEYFDTEVPRARRTLESELRAMLSGEVPMSPNPSIDRAD